MTNASCLVFAEAAGSPPRPLKVQNLPRRSSILSGHCPYICEFCAVAKKSVCYPFRVRIPSDLSSTCYPPFFGGESIQSVCIFAHLCLTEYKKLCMAPSTSVQGCSSMKFLLTLPPRSHIPPPTFPRSFSILGLPAKQNTLFATDCWRNISLSLLRRLRRSREAPDEIPGISRFVVALRPGKKCPLDSSSSSEH